MNTDKIRFYVCDDQQEFIDEIKKQMRAVTDGGINYETKDFTDGAELIEYYAQKRADAVLIDINMPNMNGFSVAEKLYELDPDVLIVFVTSHEDMVFRSFEYRPVGFVRKSHPDDLEFVMPRLLNKIDSVRKKHDGRFEFKTNSSSLRLDVNTLMYIEAVGHNICIKSNGSDDIMTRCRISDAYDQVYPLHMIRINSGIIVNCRFISKITSRELVLTDGTRLNVSRSRLDNVRAEFQKYIRSK